MAGQQHVAVWVFPFTSHPTALFSFVSKVATAAPKIQFSFFNSPKSNKSLLSAAKNSCPIPTNVRTYDVDDGCSSEEGGSDSFTERKRKNSFLNAFPENYIASMDAAQMKTGKRITCIITDSFLSDAVCKIAQRMNVPWIAFCVSSPHALPPYFQLDLIQQHYNNNVRAQQQPGDLILRDIVPGFPEIRFSDLPFKVTEKFPLPGIPEPMRSLFLSWIKTTSEASTVVMNSYQEICPADTIDYLKSKFMSLLFIGTLTVSESPLSSLDDSTGCLAWLDGQKPASVAYICFRTGAEPFPAEELVALAETLEASGFPFLWSIKDELQADLPNGFVERVKMKGKVVAWAPQSHVLKHSSIGVFVTQCGYNSVLESILGRVPMICRSVYADNHMNAKMVEEVWRIGVRVEGGKITKNGMIQSLEIIFQAEKGKEIRENINGLKQVIVKAAGPDGAADQDLKTLVDIISKE